MNEYLMSHREVIPNQTHGEKWKDITLNTGGTQSTLQDIKVAEKAGGYCYQNYSRNHNRNRFIYWRTFHDTLELSEISLDLNLQDNNVRYKFTESPVLAVSVYEVHNFVIVLVATVSSIHRLYFPHPNKLHKSELSDIRAFSIFKDVSVTSARDPLTFQVIGQSTSANLSVPHAAACHLGTNGHEAFFAMAFRNTLMLYTMNCTNGHTSTFELRQNYAVPRIFSNITEVLRGKNSADSQYVVSLVFNGCKDNTFLYALYRDEHIRMWSTKTNQCLASINCLQDGYESRSQGQQNNFLRRATPNSLCAFLCYSTGCEFITIETIEENSHFSLAITHLIPAPQFDLIDYEIADSRIWALWCNSEGDFNVSSISMMPGFELSWVSAALEPPPDRCNVSIEQGTDPRQAYCSYIFHPGKFQKSVIVKALVMFRRSNILFDQNITMSQLKHRVCQAVETEIQNEIKDYEISDDDYIDICTQYWERFYSCCEQYHNKACQPIGIVPLDQLGALCIVKKSIFSLLRPCEILEHLMLFAGNVQPDNMISPAISTDPQICRNLAQFVNILGILEHQLTDDVKSEIDKKLYQLKMPINVISKLVSEMLDKATLSRQFLTELRQMMMSISDIPQTMIFLLDVLRMNKESFENTKTYSNVPEMSRSLLAIGNLFGGSAGISLMAKSLHQISEIRYALCRNMLILQQILVDTFALAFNLLEIVRSRCMPETVVFVQAYYVMVWICETVTYREQSGNLIEYSITRLSSLQLSDNRQLYSKSAESCSLLELFLQGKGYHTGLALFVEYPNHNVSETQWQSTLLPLVSIVGRLIWAVSGNFTFGEWLIGSCQHILIQEYVRLLNGWCEWNNCSRQFICAVSLLDNGETHKAYDLFMQAAKGVCSESFLTEKILDTADNLASNEALAQYYLKVIQFFEQHNALDCVILLAQAAIGVLDFNNPQMAMFQSIVFSNHLALEHFEEAYHYLIYNAEPSRRKDCLRQLVVCLFQKKRLDLLMHFPYIGLQDELENIIESRARSMAIEDNQHYNFLYAFHVTKGNMRKASSIMYEQAMRFSLESDSVQAMQSRYNCLLNCINVLHLVDENYAWIAKPIINDDTGTAAAQIDVDESTKQAVVVLEIKDIKKELLHTEAILCLAKYRHEIGSILKAGPAELIAVLSTSGLYTAAIKLAKGFGIIPICVFENLTSACIRAADQNSNEPWAWLQENDLADLPLRNSATDMAWNLLEKLINENENRNETVLRKCVVKRILNSNAFLPQWIYSSYKESSPNELLFLFVAHGRLIEAADLAKEYIWAMLGRGGEYFGLKHSLNAASPAHCFPVNSIDLLLYGLESNIKEDIEYQEALSDLQELVNFYLVSADRISNDKANCAYQASIVMTE